ncbi:MAG: alanine--tRNA ligase [Sphingomonadales bacterium 35-56-22]|jgi:alanyl-tRNA synthetase|uniref:alanine--tRNA ligase n=1 Tax=Sphingorhabdus sp. TaxID=1902408 RepID=UPI000BD33FF8|nr:alanine--tRNA ligase [Sphingorhabdus sp.]OYY16188.1 MAG: alanine--tRNA ligase [Sphingomonadales bacterium 35-56-22]OYY96829.1 MAG: alanine--tRNA ligase [Sphingomonadales bacterium 28-56-43]OYZ61836.1 MAG: alanine--tRNA ligase [Sphingomonadales bacterium 24-56-14]OZA84055.1 MAG: alanine--tRNA ligase [Sphingomonadales bacterium 39-57-19]HQS11715.1 alanine--tRNA ligase [Sphingorhabdus sp.]
MTSTNDIRRGFLDYFGAAQHDIVSSAPLVPYNDPTLMFVNAGMVPFKNVFTGLESREIPRAASSQKCVRAGGKHNDLDNVGYTARHHTFFEMLGNFSFGDYFKEQAITHAWTLLTKEWGLDPSHLTTTVYHTDDEAFDLWRKIAGLPEERIIRIATNDNFWSMGDTGPCGPCSEIFYDHGDHIFGGPPGSPDEDGDRFVEIWNLVFMQFERQDDGTDVPLPKPSIDTGMGLERIAAVMQGVHDNYDTDTFKALINASEELTGTKAQGDQMASHRVIADHLRSTSFLLADGVMPSNEGRGYVLRRIMRRAMRHAHILGAKEPLMHRLVGSLAAEMGAAYPELLRAQPMIEATLKQEETQFRRTLDKGIKLLDEATTGMQPGDILAGDTAFKLYDTYGFPYDLTEDALRAQGLGIDQAGFETAMNNQKAMARAAWKGSGAKASDDVWFDIAERVGSTEFTGYAANEGEGQVVALVNDGVEVQSAVANDTVTVITNQTPFYGESGGQMGDAGVISSTNMRGEVTDTAKPLGRLHAHQVTIGTGDIKVGDFVTLKIDTTRRDSLRANHSATHLLHASLRERLGSHVTQKGSLVAPDRLRFDFSHNQAVTADEIAMIEADVNAQIRGNQAVTTRLMTPDDAVAAGALALFGEKYGEEVRVLTMGKTDDTHYSLELCGGTHVNALGDIALFTIISEGAVASGIRRIEALTGEAARLWLVGRETQLKNVAAMLKTAPDEVGARIETLMSERKRMEKELSEAKTALALSGGSGPKAEAETIGDVTFMGQVINGIEPKALRGLADDQMKAIGSGIVAIIAANENSNTVVVAVSPALHSTLTAPDLVRAATEAMGAQGGGGRPDMAQGGGPAGAELAQAALDAIKAKIAG